MIKFSRQTTRLQSCRMCMAPQGMWSSCRGWGLSDASRTVTQSPSTWEAWSLMAVMASLHTAGQITSCRVSQGTRLFFLYTGSKNSWCYTQLYTVYSTPSKKIFLQIFWKILIWMQLCLGRKGELHEKNCGTVSV